MIAKFMLFGLSSVLGFTWSASKSRAQMGSAAVNAQGESTKLSMVIS